MVGAPSGWAPCVSGHTLLMARHQAEEGLGTKTALAIWGMGGAGEVPAPCLSTMAPSTLGTSSRSRSASSESPPSIT